jgi:hypothetical protein
MLPSLAFPYNDPDGTMLPHLQAILPDLKAHFKRTYLSVPPDTRQNRALMAQLEAERFFTLFPLDRQMQIGEHFAHLYLNAALAANPDESLHLAYVDRLSFALETEYRKQFLEDVNSLHLDDLPLIFQRSPAAWATHPQNYARLEGFVSQIGEQLFGKTLDYGWCHLVVRAGELREVMPKMTHAGLSMVAEMILHLQHHIHTRDVDWLAWEDPFLTGRDPLEMKTEREQSLAEYEKRLSYCLPMVEALVKFSMNGKG